MPKKDYKYTLTIHNMQKETGKKARNKATKKKLELA